MDVQATESRDIQDGTRQDQPVGHNHQDIGPPVNQISPIGLLLQARGLRNRNAPVLSRQFHRARSQLAPAPLGPIRLRQDANDRMVRFEQRLEGRQREIRRPGERNA